VNLGQSGRDPGTRRPFQDGRVLGQQNGAPAATNVEWLVDTGADIVALWDSVGSLFDVVQSIGASASPTTGGGGIQVVTGIQAEFNVEDATGNATTASASGYVGIKSNNAGNNVLGVEQLADAGATVEWDPKLRTGSLRS
jgi:hypothetical protein